MASGRSFACLRGAPIGVLLAALALGLAGAAPGFAAQVPVAGRAELACPEIPPQLEEEPGTTPGRNPKHLPAVRVNSISIEVALRDANPLFLPGNEDAALDDDGIYPVLTGPASIDDLDFGQLLDLSTERIGVAADGVSRLLLILRTGAPGTFRGAPTPADESGGELAFLRQGETCAAGGGRHVGLRRC